MEALTIKEFEAICKYYYECGQKNIPFEDVYSNMKKGKITTNTK